MNLLLNGLNDQQKEAVLTTKGPVMAIAGAGSGKTSVLTRRIAYLIYHENVNPSNILAITFTNKAANEMKERVKDLIKINTYDMWISTFHSMGVKILRKYIDYLGYERTFQILDDDDTLQLIKSLMKKRNYNTKIFNPKIIRKLILKAKFDKEILDDIEMPYGEISRIILYDYQQYLKESNLVDFEDLLILPIKLLNQEKEIRDYYHERFQYILVDEFQDTNNIQYELVKKLLGPHHNLFIVGDEDQSIYAFRGANIENIKKFKHDFPKHKLILLEQNYRSTNTILTAANSVIKNNKSRIPKNLYSSKGKGNLIVHYKGVTHRDEVEYVASKITSLVKKGYKYNDIAILYRANSTSRLYEDVFLQKQIPYRIFGNLSFFKRQEIKDLTAYLRFILNPNDAFSFTRVISAPRRGIGPSTIEKIIQYAGDNELTFSDALNLSPRYLGKAQAKKLIDFMNLIIDLRQKLSQIKLDDFIDILLEKTGYLEMLKGDDKREVRYENLMEFKSILAENSEIYENVTKEEMLTYILEDIALKSEETKEEVIDGVSLMTLHSAKGLEFKIVFIVALENGMFPLSRAFSDTFELEEERRLMYVGLTRAKELLFLTNAESRQIYGEIARNDDSLFLEEIPNELIKREGYRSLSYNINKPQNKMKKPTIKRVVKNNNINELDKGDKVKHKVFGEGIVVSVAKDQCVIAFAQPHGIKTLLKDHPAITKIS